MSKRIRLTVEQVLESILTDSDEDLEDLDDPDEPIMEGSDDDFEDLYDDLNEEVDEGRDVPVLYIV